MKNKLSKSIKFSLTIAVITFVLAAIFSIISSALLNNVMWIIGLLIVFVIVLIGVMFDILGIASTAGREAPFHAMASEKVSGAREAIVIIRNADKFSSFCNDVIGDISGIVSGTATVVVVLQISQMLNHNEESYMYLILSVLLTSLVAAFTVGGKALGKFLAINYSTNILLITGKIISLIQEKLKINLLPKNK